MKPEFERLNHKISINAETSPKEDLVQEVYDKVKLQSGGVPYPPLIVSP